jgi:hypothetical protein
VVTSRPPSSMRPDVGASKPAIIRRTVVLPEPEGPSIEKNSPSRICRSMSSTATTGGVPGNSLRSRDTATADSAAGVVAAIGESPLTVRSGLAGNIWPHRFPCKHRVHSETFVWSGTVRLVERSERIDCFVRVSRCLRGALCPLEAQGRADAVTRRLADVITLGLLPDGSPLPSEADLAERFGVATVTMSAPIEQPRLRERLPGPHSVGFHERAANRPQPLPEQSEKRTSSAGCRG